MNDVFGFYEKETPEQKAAWEKRLAGMCDPDPKDALTWPDQGIRRIVAEIRAKHPDEAQDADDQDEFIKEQGRMTINDHTTSWRDIGALAALIFILSFAFWLSEHTHFLSRISLLLADFAR